MLSKLNSDQTKILKISSIFFVLQIFFTFSLNLYIFKYYNNLTNIVLGNLFATISIFLGFAIIYIINHKVRISIGYIYNLSFALFAVAGLCIIANNIYMLLLGYFIFGLANGLYYFATNFLEIKSTTPEGSLAYSSIFTNISGISNLIIPIFTGIIIANFGNGALANNVIFGLQIFLSIVGLIFSINITDNFIQPQNYQTDRQVLYNITKQNKYNLTYWFFKGMLGMSSFLGIMVGFFIIKSSINISIYESATRILSFIFVFLIGKYISNHFDKKLMLIICIIISVITWLFGFYFGIVSFVVFTIAKIFLWPIFATLDKPFALAIIQKYKSQNISTISAMVYQELLMLVGRVFIVMCIYMVGINYGDLLALQIGLGVYGFVFLIVSYIYYHDKI